MFVLCILLRLRVQTLAIQLRAAKMSAQWDFGRKEQLNRATGVLCLQFQPVRHPDQGHCQTAAGYLDVADSDSIPAGRQMGRECETIGLRFSLQAQKSM